jgi:hypothetical protein
MKMVTLTAAREPVLPRRHRDRTADFWTDAPTVVNVMSSDSSRCPEASEWPLRAFATFGDANVYPDPDGRAQLSAVNGEEKRSR